MLVFAACFLGNKYCPVERFEKDATKAFCEAAVECGAYQNVDACRNGAEMKLDCERYCEDYGPWLDFDCDGDLVFDPSDAELCIESVRTFYATAEGCKLASEVGAKFMYLDPYADDDYTNDPGPVFSGCGFVMDEQSDHGMTRSLCVQPESAMEACPT